VNLWTGDQDMAASFLHRCLSRWLQMNGVTIGDLYTRGRDLPALLGPLSVNIDRPDRGSGVNGVTIRKWTHSRNGAMWRRIIHRSPNCPRELRTQAQLA
jgi:hypothetical protein